MSPLQPLQPKDDADKPTTANQSENADHKEANADKHDSNAESLDESAASHLIQDLKSAGAATADSKPVSRGASNEDVTQAGFPRAEISADLPASAGSLGKISASREPSQLTHELKRELSRDPSQLSKNLESKNQKGFLWSPDSLKSNANLNSANRPFFQMRKSAGAENELIGTEESSKRRTDVNKAIQQYLTESNERSSLDKLLESDRKNLAEAREKLAESMQESQESAVEQCLQLAKLYEKMHYADEAKQACELALNLDPNNLLALEQVKDLENTKAPDLAVVEKNESAQSEGQPLTKRNLRKRIKALSGGKIVVVGDLLIDELLEGKPERISREAPVLILEHVDTVLIPGGAANTAHNVSALGGKCHAIGICGRDEYAQKMAQILEKCGITHSLVPDSSRPTTVKTRIISKSHSLMQQLLRLDRISHEPIHALIESILIEKIKQVAGEYKAIILSDYKAGVISDGVIKTCRKLAKETNTQVIVDAQGTFERFRDCTLLTPNQPDAENALGYQITSEEVLRQAGQDLLELSGVAAMLVTRGGQGMALFERGQPPLQLPAFNRSDVFDVTGAGDTVVATMTLALVTGSTFFEAMALGNLAASIVVRKSGTAVTNQLELITALEHLNLPE